MRTLAVDYGVRRIGLAISDDKGTLAMGLGLIERSRGETEEQLADRVAARAKEEGAGEIVVGLPRHMDGGESESTRAAHRFSQLLGIRAGVRVGTWDERLSTNEARRRLRDAPLSRGRKRAHVNVVAALVILEDYLAHRSSGG